MRWFLIELRFLLCNLVKLDQTNNNIKEVAFCDKIKEHISGKKQRFDVEHWFFCSYTLVSYDKNYSKYLEAFGIPSAIISMFILGASETINVTRTDESIQFLTQMGGIEHMWEYCTYLHS